MINLQIIGTAHTCFKEKFAIPRQAGLSPHSTGTLILKSPYNREEALRGLDTFSHMIITFSPHLAHSNSLVVRPPRLGGNKKMGVFATRSPFRPNAICSSIVKIEKVDFIQGEIEFSNHDILNETPILDIKPYIPRWDCKPNANAGWLESDVNCIEEKEITIKFKEGIDIKDELKSLIYEVLSLDPKPSYQVDKTQYAFKIDDFDVHFSYLTPQRILVFEVLKLT